MIPGFWRRTITEQRTTMLSGTAIASGEAYVHGGPLELPPDAPKTLCEALQRTAERWPSRGLTVYELHSEVFVSYPDLLERARCVLTGLRSAGLASGDRVMLALPSIAEHYACFWACLLGGLLPVTVPAKRAGICELLGRPTILRDGFDALVAHAPATELTPSRGVAFYQLSSGSTGVPKCIQITHEGVLDHVYGVSALNGYGEDDVDLNWLPVDHVVPILTSHLKDTVLGIHQVQVAPERVLADPLTWLDLMEKHRVTHSFAPNFAYKLVSEAIAKSPARSWDLSAIQRLVSGGEQVTLPVAQGFLAATARFGLRRAALQPAFGMAEVCTGISYAQSWTPEVGIFRVRKASLGGVLEEARNDDDAIDFVDLGPVRPGLEVRIVDAGGRVVAERVIGSLEVRGRAVTPGHVDNTAADREAFVGGGWFKTGDLGFLRDGRLTVTGRQKEVIIVRGANLYAYEIEDAIGSVPGVDPTWVGACPVDDGATEALAVFFVPSSRDDSVVQRVRERVTADFGITPRYVVPIARAHFPKTTSGKIQRNQLKRDLIGGRFDGQLEAADLALENENTLPPWFHRPVWIRHELPRVPVIPANVVTIIDRTGDVAALLELVPRLRTPAQLIVAASHSYSDPMHAAVRGLVRTIARECPGVGARHIDLPPDEPEQNAERLMREAAHAGDGEVRYADGARWVRCLERATPSATCALPWKRGDLVVVTGGMGAVGGTITEHLVEREGLRVLVVGRTPRPAGDNPRYEHADATDVGAMRGAIARAEEHFGVTVAGAIHLAGGYAERLLVHETSDALLESLRPKVEGARVLRNVLGPDPFLVAIGSAYSMFGGVSVGAYTAAHCALEAALAGDARATVVAFTYWNGSELLREHARRQGYAMIGRERAIISLLCCLCDPSTTWFVGLDDERPNVKRQLAAHLGQEVRDERPLPKRRGTPRNDRERALAAILCEVLGIEHIDPDASFFALGAESIDLVQFLARLGDKPTIVDLFRYPTIRALARFLEGGDSANHHVQERARKQRAAFRRAS